MEKRDPVDIDVKRLYLPGCSISDACPSCGSVVNVDFEQDYLSYPTANVPMWYGFYCHSCDRDWQRKIMLTLSVELLPRD